MFDKEQTYKTIWIICTVLCVIGLIVTFVSRYYLILVFIAFIGMIFFGCLMNKEKRKKAAQAENAENDKPQFDEAELATLLEHFEFFAKTAITLKRSENKSFTRFGGVPFAPQDFVWPTHNNKPIPFLLQIDFAEINADGKLSDFPESGLMYVFVDESKVNFEDTDINDTDYAYKEGETFKILYFENVDGGLNSVELPDNLQTIYDEFYVNAELVKTYPELEDCNEDDCEQLSTLFRLDKMDNYYDYFYQHRHLIGGWATYVQGGGFIADRREKANEKWTLLVQIENDGQYEFMWGDEGTLYFYINENDLKKRNFSNVTLDMQCT